jgi:hypothetical protein
VSSCGGGVIPGETSCGIVDGPPTIPQEVLPGMTTPPQELTATQDHTQVEQHRYWTTNNCFNTQKHQAGHTVFLPILRSHRILDF